MTDKRSDDETSFEGLVDLGTLPPPPGPTATDVHAARTAIAELPQSLLDELKRAKNDAAPTRQVERFDLQAALRSEFGNEAPTAPGKTGAPALRPIAPELDEPTAPPSADLAAALTGALAQLDETSADEPRSFRGGTQPLIVVEPPTVMLDPAALEPPPRPRARARAIRSETIVALMLAFATGAAVVLAHWILYRFQ